MNQVSGDHVREPLLVLQPPTDVEQVSLKKGIAVSLRDARPNNQIDDARLILERHKRRVVGSAWT